MTEPTTLGGGAPDPSTTQTKPAGDAPAAGATAPEGTAPTDWRAALPEDLRGDKTLGRYQTLDAAAKALVEQHKVLSQALTKIPGPDAKPEEIAAFREKLGVPKTADGYELKPPAGTVVWDDATLGAFKQVFHAAGIPTAQAQALLEGYGQYQDATHARLRQEYRAGLDALKTEWGELSYAKRTTLAAKVIAQFAPEDVRQFLDTTGLGDHPGLVRMFAELGERLAEDDWIDGQVQGAPTPDAIKAEIDAMFANKQHPYWQDGHPEHAAAVGRWRDLHAALQGPQKRR